MPNTYVRLNLASSISPFYTQAAGRTVMIPEEDENWDRYNAANTTQDKGVPQVFYMHNVVPIAGGFQSIGYIAELAGLNGHTDFDICLNVINSDLSTSLFVPAAGSNYVYDGNIGAWQSVSPLAAGAVPAGVLVTTAYVQGTTYIYYANNGCYKYDNTTDVMTPVTLTGLVAANVIGICAANGYMIAWTSSAIAWSSLTDPTNFTPSIQTGAGGGSVQDAKGPINFCLSINGGFLIYCEKNVVGATYTANTSFPYVIVEVPGSGGVNLITDVAFQSNLPYHIAMTTSGIQQIGLSSAVATMPEVSDFLTAQVFEDFSEVTFSFTQQYLSAQLARKFACVADRYIVISYGVTAPSYTHAILFDIALNRYGKIKLDHRSAFMYTTPAPHGYVTYAQLLNTPIDTLGTNTYSNFFTSLQPYTTAKQNLAFMQQDGTIQLVDFTVAEINADGVFIIGKFQLRRSNIIVHQKTEVETVTNATKFAMYVLPTFDGKDFGTAVATINIQQGALTQRYAKRISGSNLSLCMIGAFDMTSIVANFTVGGSR